MLSLKNTTNIDSSNSDKLSVPISTIQKSVADDLGSGNGKSFDQTPNSEKLKGLNYDSGNGGGSSESNFPDSNQLSPTRSTAGSVERFSDNLITPDTLSPNSSVSNNIFSQRQQPINTKSDIYNNMNSNRLKDNSYDIFRKDSDSNTNNNDNLQKQLAWMQRNMDMLKQENAALEKALATSGGAYNWPVETNLDPSSFSSSSSRPTQNPAFLISNFKLEMATFKSELSKISSALESCELGRKSLSDRWVMHLQTNLQQMNSSLKQLLCQNLENPVEKSLIISLQSRLKSTEERLKINRREMVDNLSKAEERLLLENAHYQMSENEMRRKVQQMNSQLQNMRRKQQGLVEVCQRLKIKSSENGHIDVTELLKRFAPLDLDDKFNAPSASSSSAFTTDSIQQQQQQPDLTATRNQISTLINEKHSLSSEVNSLNDENILMKLENDRLKKSMNELNATWKMDVDEFKSNQNNTINKVLKQMEAFTNEVSHLCRCDSQSAATVKILEDVINSKERLLTSTLTEVDRLRSLSPPPTTTTTTQHNPSSNLENTKQNENLSAILDFMKHRHELENKDQEQASFLSSLQPPPSSSLSSNELHQLNLQCSKLENDLEFAEKNLEFQKDQVAKLQAQLSANQDELRQKKQSLDLSLSNEMDLKRELKMNKEWLEAVNAQLIEKEKELMMAELDKGSVRRLLEKDKVDFEAGGSGDEKADVKFIKQALELDIMASRNALDSSLKENTRLKIALDRAARDLLAERDVTSSATYDKMVLQQQLYTALEEKEKEVRDREKLQTELALLKLENQKLATGLQSKVPSSEPDKELREAYDNLSAQQMKMKQMLESKEKENLFLQDTLKFVLKSNNKEV